MLPLGYTFHAEAYSGQKYSNPTLVEFVVAEDELAGWLCSCHREFLCPTMFKCGKRLRPATRLGETLSDDNTPHMCTYCTLLLEF